VPDNWYIARDGKQHGPVSRAEFVELVKQGHLLASDQIWHEGLSEWLPAANFLARQEGVGEALTRDCASQD
jgi:hypothetical protein